MAEYAQGAEGRGLEVIIAGAGGAAHLPGMVASHTLLPVLGVPVESQALQRARFAAVDRADARRRSGRHAGHRQGGGDQRGPAGGRPSSPPARPSCARSCATFRAEQTAQGPRRTRCP